MKGRATEDAAELCREELGAARWRSVGMRYRWWCFVGLVFVVGACTADAVSTATPGPVIESTAVESTATAATTLVPPTAGPYPIVAPRRGYPEVAPGEDYAGVGLGSGGLPLGATGEVIVYAKELPGLSERMEIMVFDLNSEVRLSSFMLEAISSIDVTLAGRRVIVWFGRELWSYALDGSDGRLISDELPISYMRPSPDGRYLAVAGSAEDSLASVVLLDVRSGAVVQRVDLLSALPTWRGEPYPVRWLSNEAVLIGGLCSCDGLLEGFFDAEVGLDGSVARLPDDWTGAEPVGVEITDAFDTSCMLGGFTGGRTVQLVETATGEVLAQAREDAPVLIDSRLSPDGSEALVMRLDADGELRALLNEALAAGECVDWERARGPSGPSIEFTVLRAGGTMLEPVVSRLEVLERWHDGLVPVIGCEDEERAAVDTSNWLDPAPWRDPAGFGEPWGFSSDECEAGRALLEMRVGDVAVDTGAAGYRVLGFLDAAEGWGAEG